jgi:hypothetical protein
LHILVLTASRHLQDAVFQEKEQVTYIFHVLRSLYSEDPSVELVPRQPTYSLLLLAHAHRSIFYPASFLYPLVSRFLLQRPELDKGDVPLLFSMLYSSTDDWKKERSWMLKFIGDGMKSTNDWRVLKRRHTWELLASLFQSGDNDRPLRNAILEVSFSLLLCRTSFTSSSSRYFNDSRQMRKQLHSSFFDHPCYRGLKFRSPPRNRTRYLSGLASSIISCELLITKEPRTLPVVDGGPPYASR